MLIQMDFMIGVHHILIFLSPTVSTQTQNTEFPMFIIQMKLQFGINRIINKKSSLAIELSSFSDGAKGLNKIYLPLNKWISSTNSFAIVNCQDLQIIHL